MNFLRLRALRDDGFAVFDSIVNSIIERGDQFFSYFGQKPRLH